MKYKALTEEHNNLKRENQLLKKAMQAEQEKNATGAGLSRANQETKQKALEEENDLLKYNNERLTKRVMVLQEATNQKKQESRQWFNWGSTDDTNKQQEELKLFMEEIERKTAENEMLHNEVALVKHEQQQVVELLQAKIVLLKSNIESEKEEYLKKDTEHQEKLAAIEQEKAVYTTEITNLTTKLQKLQEEINQKVKQLQENELKSTQFISAYSNIIQRQISFDDTNCSAFNAFNLPSFNKNIESHHRELVQEAVTLFIDLGQSFTEEYAAYQDRVTQLAKAKELTPQLIQAHKKVGEFLSLFPKQLLPLTEACQKRFGANATESSNKLFFESAMNFVVYHQKLISWIQLSLKEESVQEDTDPSTVHFNESLNELFGELHECFYRLLFAFYSPSPEHGDNIETDATANVREAIERLQDGCLQVVGCRKGIALLNHSKLMTEYNDAFLLPRLRTANESYEACVAKTNTCLMALQQLFERYHDAVIVKPSQAPVRGVVLRPTNNNSNSDQSSATSATSASNVSRANELFARASDAMSRVNQLAAATPPPYVPHSEYQKQAGLLQQVRDENAKMVERLDLAMKDIEANNTEKAKTLVDLSKSKEENALKQSRINALLSELLEKRKTIDNLREKRAAGESDAGQSAVAEEAKKEEESFNPTEGHHWELTVMDGAGHESTSLPSRDDIQAIETRLEKHYADKLSSLNNTLRLSDSRVVEMFQHQERLEKQIAQLKIDKEELMKNLQSAFMQHSLSVDDHDTTKENYDQQLNILSDHVVQLTQKIAATEDQLDALKACKVRCGRCKTWNTIEWLITEGKNGQLCSRGNHPSSFNFA